MTLWDDTVKKSPRKARPYHNRGYYYAGQDSSFQPWLILTRPSRLTPYTRRAYYNRGFIYFKQNNLPQALSDYTKAIAFNPDPHDTRAYNNCGLLYAKQNNLTQALATYTKAIAFDPADAQAYNDRGIIYG